MSWSFKFCAKDKPTALAVLETISAPAVAKEFVAAAIVGLRDDSNGYSSSDKVENAGKFVHVKSEGHLCDGPASYEVSTNSTQVEWIYLSQPRSAPVAA